MKKSLVFTGVIGIAVIAATILSAVNVQAQVWPPPTSYGYYTPAVRPGGIPTFNVVNPFTGRTHRLIDGGRLVNGLPPEIHNNSSGGTDLVYSAPQKSSQSQTTNLRPRSNRPVRTATVGWSRPGSHRTTQLGNGRTISRSFRGSHFFKARR